MVSPPVTSCTRPGGCKTQLLLQLGEETAANQGSRVGPCPQSHHVELLLLGRKKGVGKGDGILLGLSSTVAGEAHGCLL